MADASILEQHYPQTCPFCNIAAAYPACVPQDVDTSRVTPDCFLVLSAPRVLAFLDIMPMTKGHLLVTTRAHRGKLADVAAGEAADAGFWLPLLAKTVTKVTNTTDYNIVQNNGARAAQVVPHVHFHIIPRPASMPELANKSWTMFGRGQREDLDDDDAAALAAEMRRVLRAEIEALRRDEKGKL
ncbi:HIT-like protein [Saccharata proteae CBS 121410]|uniref:HIT-like protein n=1 Tax=Saccharata proteae CBS 121410 TaxID=1314787 RepID=A0A6A5YAV4_9PEZI|nr:HIT-like protein [Saccharata proteae CBS 121410]